MKRWRPGADSNRCTRICNPLDSLSPTGDDDDLTQIVYFTTGSASTTDVFDYKSDLVAGSGSAVSSSSDFTLTTIDSAERATNVIAPNSTGVIEFVSTNLSIDLMGPLEAKFSQRWKPYWRVRMPQPTRPALLRV